MRRRLFDLATRWFLTGCLLVFSLYTWGQGCCPEPGTCSPCSGGVSELTLQYHGNMITLVTVRDGSGLLMQSLVIPGQIFTVEGQTNGHFQGNEVWVTRDLTGPTISISANCSLQFDPWTRFGSFTIVAAESKNGGVMCCSGSGGPTEPPEIFNCPNNIFVDALANCTATATWIRPVAPGCEVSSFTSTHNPGATFQLGTTTVTYTARSFNGLTNTCSFNVVVRDVTAPTVRKSTADIIVDAGSNCKATATWTPPQFDDNCGVSTVTSTHNPGSVFSLGITTVTYTATDGAGRSTNSSFSVTVKDTTPPVKTLCAGNVTVQATAGCSAKASWTVPTFTDACGPVTVTSTHRPGDTFDAGRTTVVYTARDAASNTATCSFEVIVIDAKPPTIVNCPGDTTITVNNQFSARYAWTSPAATDDCTEVILESDHLTNEEFFNGRTTVTYTATDQSGNRATCAFDVTIHAEASPLDVVQLLTPDGDARNDEWVIGNIELYPDNSVVIVDRWGSVVYSISGYDNERNVWAGRNQNGIVVPSGTYFYTIKFKFGNNVMEQRGFLEVLQ